MNPAPRPHVREVARLFDTDPCGDGYIVVDTRMGRPLTEPRSLKAAQAAADKLNHAASQGRKALARALGAVDGDEVAPRL